MCVTQNNSSPTLYLKLYKHCDFSVHRAFGKKARKCLVRVAAFREFSSKGWISKEPVKEAKVVNSLFRHHDTIYQKPDGKQARLIIQDLQVNILILCKQVFLKRDRTEFCPIEMNQGY